MRQHGRKSAASLAIVAPAFGSVRRPPPKHLSVAEAREWRAVVNLMPADWFESPDILLLERLAVHLCAAKVMTERVREAIAGGMESKPLSELLDTQRAETHEIASLMTKMRLLKQNQQQPTTAGRRMARMSKAVPWGDDAA